MREGERERERENARSECGGGLAAAIKSARRRALYTARGCLYVRKALGGERGERLGSPAADAAGRPLAPVRYLSIRLSIDLFIYPSIHPTIHPSGYPIPI